MEFEDNSTQKVVCGLLFGVRLAFFALKKQFVLSSFFGTFVDSTGLIEFIPSILVSFSVFEAFPSPPGRFPISFPRWPALSLI
jgi:hypothetical protein